MAKSRTSYVEAMGQAHADLLADIHKLEKAASSAAPEAPAKLATQLGKLRQHLAEHFRFEEEDGYMAAVLRIESRLANEVEALLEEHHQMAQGLEAILEEVRAAKGPGGVPRDKIEAWIKQVRQHESRENHLVQEAFYSDTGTGD